MYLNEVVKKQLSYVEHNKTVLVKEMENVNKYSVIKYHA